MSFDHSSGRTRRRLAFAFVVSLLCATGLWACDEKDPYADAPSATASGSSTASGSAGGESDGQQRDGPPGGRSAGLPPGHPPVESNNQAKSDNETQSEQTEGGYGAPSATNNDGSTTNAGGTPPARNRPPLTWSLPSAWTSVQPSTRMRLAEYRVPGTPNTNPASLGVFHFGRRGGGDIQANIERWKKQFTAPNGGKPTANVEVRKLDGGALTVHTVDISGTYEPGVGMGGGQARKGQRMLAAIVASPDGLYFFKLVGPEATVGNATGGFEALVESLSYQGT